MRIDPSQSRTRRFQEQLVPAYLNSGLDFFYDISLKEPSDNIDFGLKSSDGSIRSRYKFRTGFIYDYADRFVGTYRGGETKIQFGLKSGLVFSSGSEYFSCYEMINQRPISFEDIYVGYESAPFDRFYIENNGSTSFDFDLSIKGFIPPTVFSDLIPLGGDIYSGKMTQSGLDLYPSQAVPYGMFGFSINPVNGSTGTFESNGIGELSYTISGNSLFKGQTIDLEFDTYFGKVLKTLTVDGGDGDTSNGETGIVINVHGESNLLKANQSLIFEVSYFSNAENDVYISLESSESFSSPTLSGSGMGSLGFSGYISKSGLIYGDKYITGTANLTSTLNPNNTIFNTQYDLYDTSIAIRKLTAARTTGVFFTGENTFLFTGIPIVGQYNGPYAPFQGFYFSGLGDVEIVYDFQESDEGVHQFNENWLGRLNTGYSDVFYIAGSTSDLANPSNRTQENARNSNIFPTGFGFGFIDRLVTGRGNVFKSYDVGLFFGEGTGRVYDSRIEAIGSGDGEVLFNGDAYDWVSRGTTDIFPPIDEIASSYEDDIEGLLFRLQLHNGDNVPANIYTDVDLIFPATEEGDLVAAWVDTIDNVILRQDTPANRPELTFTSGVPGLRFSENQYLTGEKTWSNTSALTVMRYTPSGDSTYTVFEAGANSDTWFRFSDGNAYMGIFRTPRVSSFFASPTTGETTLSVWSDSTDYQVWRNGSLIGSTAGAFDASFNGIIVGSSFTLIGSKTFSGIINSVYVHPSLAARESLETVSEILSTYSEFSSEAYYGAYSLLDPVEGHGILSNDSASFKGTGLPRPLYQTWGYPTGPSQIVIQPQVLTIYADLTIPLVTGFRGSLGGSIVPATTGFTGRAVGYVNFGGATLEGPIFPPPDDLIMRPYAGDNFILGAQGDSYYGRGMIVNKGGRDNGISTDGLYLENSDGSDFEVTWNIETGDFKGTHDSGIGSAFLQIPFIFPARRVTPTDGDPFLVYSQVSLVFQDSNIDKNEDAFIHGAGYIPVSALMSKYNMYYSTEDGVFPALGYRENAWFESNRYIAMSDGNPAPFNYPIGAQRAYIKIQSNSNDTESFDQLTLKAFTTLTTGEVIISTNSSV